MLVAYGGGGGLRCAATLQAVLKGLQMQVVESPVGIVLPRQYVGGPERVLPREGYPAFLDPYEELINKAADKLKDKIFEARAEEAKRN